MVSFGLEDMKGVSDPNNDAFIVRAILANYEVAWIFVDSGSLVNILFKEAMDQMDLYNYKIEHVVTVLFGFIGHPVSPVGMINLPLYLGEGSTQKTRIISFVIVDASYVYNVILDRPAMTTFMAVSSALHQKINFPVGIAMKN